MPGTQKPLDKCLLTDSLLKYKIPECSLTQVLSASPRPHLLEEPLLVVPDATATGKRSRPSSPACITPESLRTSPQSPLVCPRSPPVTKAENASTAGGEGSKNAPTLTKNQRNLLNSGFPGYSSLWISFSLIWLSLLGLVYWIIIQHPMPHAWVCTNALTWALSSFLSPIS